MDQSDSSEESDTQLEQSDLVQNPEGPQRGTLTHVPPLDVGFSQKKMRHMLWNGSLLEDAATLVRAVRCSKEDEIKFSAPWRLESPFPPIEVALWRAKLRDHTTGRPKLDQQTGKVLFDREENLYTLDNRRLYLLQLAAAAVWPERCVAEVAEMPAGRPELMREVKKFKTVDSGRSILIGSRKDNVPFVRWCWRARVNIADPPGTARRGGNAGSKVTSTTPKPKATSTTSNPKAKSSRKPNRKAATDIVAFQEVSKDEADRAGAMLLRLLKDGDTSRLALDSQIDGAAQGAQLLGILKGCAPLPTKDAVTTIPANMQDQYGGGDDSWWDSTEWWQERSQPNGQGSGRRHFRGRARH